MKQAILILVLLALVMVPSAFALDANLSRTDKTYYLQRNLAATDVLTFTNTSSDRACYDLLTSTTDSRLVATAATDHFCLNGHETTELSVTLSADKRLSDGTYSVTATVYGATDQNSVVIPVVLTNSTPIGFTPPNTTICQEYNEFDIEFTNNSDGIARIRVSASSESLLPVFRTQLMQLAGGGQTNRLRINANSNTPPGDYNYIVLVETDHAFILKKGTITVRDCDTNGFVDFTLTDNDLCPQVSPGETRTVYVQLQNNSGQGLDLDLNVENDRFDLSLNDKHLFLGNHEIRNIPIVVRVPQSIQAGSYFLEFSAKTGSFKQTIGVCINVTGSAALRFLQNNFTVERGETVTAQLEVKNTTSVFQDTFLEFVTLGSDFDATFSTQDFGLSGNTTRTVLVKIQVHPDALLGPHTVTVRSKTLNGSATATLNLRVVTAGGNTDQNQAANKYLSFISYPSTIDLNAGQVKRLYFTLSSEYRERLSGIRLEFQNLPSYLSFDPLTEISVDANGNVQLTGVLRASANAPSAISKPVLWAGNAYYYTATGVEITTHAAPTGENGTAKPPAQDPFGGFVSGFVGFAGQNASLVGILLLIAVALILLQAVTAQPKNESRPWLKK